MTDQTTPAPAARVTIDDVRTVLEREGIDPNQTNAGKVRALLGGRGSFETIQKHLNTLRAELAAAAMPPVSVADLPPIPTELSGALAAFWSASFSAAQVQTLRRSEQLAAERDGAFLKLETMSKDLADLLSTVDDQAARLDQAAATVAQVQADHLADLDRLKVEAEAAAAQAGELAVELDRARQDLAQCKANAQHAAQMAEAGRDLLREELGRMTDQIAELKAALYTRVQNQQAPSDSTSPSPAGN